MPAIDHCFDDASARDLQERLKPLIRKTQPYAKKIAHRMHRTIQPEKHHIKKYLTLAVRLRPL
jgi:hypothetical protein